MPDKAGQETKKGNDMKENSVGRKLIAATLALITGSAVIGTAAAPVHADTTAGKVAAPRITACTIVAHRILA